MSEAAADESPAENKKSADAVETAKAAGREAFLKEDFEEAIKMYTEAINLNGSDHVLYSNRSAAYAGLADQHKVKKNDAARLTALNHALEDGQKCVSLRPDFAKGYGRIGYAFHYLERYDEAKQAYEKGLQQVAEMEAGTEKERTSLVMKQGIEDVEKYRKDAQHRQPKVGSETQASSAKPRRSGLKGTISKLVNPLDLSTKGALLYAISVVTVIVLIVLYQAHQSMATTDSDGEIGDGSDAFESDL